MFKSQIDVFLEDSKYYPDGFYRDLEEDEYTTEILMLKWNEEIGTSNKCKEKVEDSPILKEFNKEYKKIYARHYKHPKEFPENKFKQWSKKAIELRDSFDDKQIEEFKIALNKLSNLYCKI